MVQPIPIIIDTDPGVDDAIAIMMAASSEKLNIVGMTPVDGNVGYAQTFRNALDLRDFLGLDFPVAKGAETQLARRREHSLRVHGKNGLGSLELPQSQSEFHPKRAWDFIYDEALRLNGELELLAIAPLTNIANLLIKHPDVKPYIKRITMMGGSMWLGNRTKFSEFNMWMDPAAAEVVFSSGIPITMAGLNATMPSGISRRALSEITSGASKYARALQALIDSYEDVFPNMDLEEAVVVHDAIPVAYLINPDICRTFRGEVEVCTDDAQYGRTRIRFDRPDRYNCTIINSIDMRRYERLYKDMMSYFERRSVDK